MTAMPISTEDYLIEKKALEENIDWHIKTINTIDLQNDQRRERLKYLEERLYNLQKEYYNEIH